MRRRRTNLRNLRNLRIILGLTGHMSESEQFPPEKALPPGGGRRIILAEVSRGAAEANMSLGPAEIAFIVVVVLLLFGAKRLPELGRSVGQGLREFKKSVAGLGEDITPPPEEGKTPPGKD